MLEAQIIQKASFSSRPSDRVHSKPEPNPREHCSCVTMKEEQDLTESEEVQTEKGREITTAGNMERNNDSETATFKENDTIEIAAISHLISLIQVVFLSPTF